MLYDSIIYNQETYSNWIMKKINLQQYLLKIKASCLPLENLSTVLPTPIKPWTVNFPLDERELSEMETNLKFN